MENSTPNDYLNFVILFPVFYLFTFFLGWYVLISFVYKKMYLYLSFNIMHVTVQAR